MRAKIIGLEIPSTNFLAEIEVGLTSLQRNRNFFEDAEHARAFLTNLSKIPSGQRIELMENLIPLLKGLKSATDGPLLSFRNCLKGLAPNKSSRALTIILEHLTRNARELGFEPLIDSPYVAAVFEGQLWHSDGAFYIPAETEIEAKMKKFTLPSSIHIKVDEGLDARYEETELETTYNYKDREVTVRYNGVIGMPVNFEYRTQDNRMNFLENRDYRNGLAVQFFALIDDCELLVENKDITGNKFI